ncbi:MAG: hypothetical protein LBQ63_05750 [Deltaproteobacteria bacterium]|nr:hypothetical protein [Deltaproteobacteria bacterium]
MRIPKDLYIWIFAFILMSLICLLLLVIAENQIPDVNLSNGIVAIISAFIGVILTVLVTNILLKRQSESEWKKEKDIAIHQQKILVFSEFISELWGIIEDGKIERNEIERLRNIFLKKIVFHLNDNEIEKIIGELSQLKNKSKESFNDKNGYIEIFDHIPPIFGNITRILQNNLKDEEIKKETKFLTLYNSFNFDSVFEDKGQGKDTGDPESASAESRQNVAEVSSTPQISPEGDEPSYWHFNMLYPEQQIKAFKDGKWELALLEYGEDWRTCKIKSEVSARDVVFLFQRGGPGYVGVFKVRPGVYRVFGPGRDETDANLEYDIYGGVEDGATWCSNLKVTPVAFSSEGVGYESVRRKTIDRMRSGWTWILEQFNTGANDGKYGDGMPVEGIDHEAFAKILILNDITPAKKLE